LGSIKRRAIPYYGPRSEFRREFFGLFPDTHGFEDTRNLFTAFQGTQVTESENHPGWEYKFRRPFKGAGFEELNLDSGGEFTMRKKWVELPRPLVPQFLSTGLYFPTGSQTPRRESVRAALLPLNPADMPFPPSAESNDSALAALGTTAVSECAPTNQVASLATALLETYHDGIPRVLGSSLWQAHLSDLRDSFRTSGDEYLNVTFGWAPLVSDIMSTARGVANSHKLITQYVRDDGKVVRRRYNFPPIITESNVTVSSGVSPVYLALSQFSKIYGSGVNTGKVERNRITTINRWFSGAFTYHIPQDTGSVLDGHANKAIELLGLDLNPEVLYNLTPWSWAVDWFSNLGDVVHNVSDWATDGLVMRYGYIMEHSVVRDTYTFIGPTGLVTSGVYPQSVRLTTEVKLRRRATPFGFGFNMSALSARQKAIVAALGITRI
jgi:hypothetical protein